ncbi:MAG: rhodanese-like domain-containing protein [Bacteroidales bacterium]
MKFVYGMIFSLVMSVLSLLGQDIDNTEYKDLKPHDFQLLYLKTDSSLLVDVREPFEFNHTRIKDAVNIPSSGNIGRAADTLNKNITYFLYCSTGHRSANVAKMMYDMGFHKLVNLDGGIVAWRKDGLKVKRRRMRR